MSHIHSNTDENKGRPSGSFSSEKGEQTRSAAYHKKRTKKRLLNALLIICILVFGVSLYFIISILGEYKGAQNSYASLQQIAVIETSPSSPSSFESPSDGSESSAFDPLSRTIDFEQLQAINPDIIAWLYLPGTVIDYPVVQGQDNDFYLSHTADLQKNASGAIFADYRSDLLEDKNTTLYGHNMKDDSMFHEMLSFQDQEFYEAHPYFYLYTPSHVYQLSVFSAYTTNASAHYTTSSFGSDQEYLDFLHQLANKGHYTTDVSLTAFDQIVTFSTCAYTVEDGRFAVHAKVQLIQ